jgi:hypothetical protein
MNSGNHVANLHHFVIAVWESKKAESGPREVMGNHS